MTQLFESPANDTLLSFAVSEVTSSTESGVIDMVVSSTMKRVIIPSIGVDMEIVDEEGISEEEAFLRGAWLLPRTAVPNRDSGNTVIAAHRFLYTSGPNTFYHLDKVKEGDEIIVEWQGERFVYTVSGSKVVPPTAVEILTPTEAPMLTLFTCTPIFTTKNRLVVTAKLSTKE